jgi:hypothetical protein
MFKFPPVTPLFGRTQCVLTGGTGIYASPTDFCIVVGLLYAGAYAACLYYNTPTGFCLHGTAP